MIETTQAAMSAIAGNARSFRARILVNGTETSGYVRQADIYKGSCGDGAFLAGCAFAGYTELLLDRCTDDLDGKEFTLEVGVIVGNAPVYAQVGRYTATEVTGRNQRLQVTGQGPIGARMEGGAAPMVGMVSEVIAAMETACGVDIVAPSDLMGFTVTVPDGLKWRDVLAHLAGLYFGYAYEDSEGRIRIESFTRPSAEIWAVNDDMTVHDTSVSASAMTVHGVSVQTDEEHEPFTAGTPVDMELINPLMTSEIFEAMSANVIGAESRPCVIPVTLGTYLIEPVDIVEYTPSGSAEALRIAPMGIKIHFDGGLTTEISAPGTIQSDYSMGRLRGPKGEDATVLRIDSSRGVLFKNSVFGTVLTVTIQRGAKTITDAAAMRAEYGSGAFLQWYWRKFEDEEWRVMLISDEHISDSGFTLTITPDDVDEKIVFKCELEV